MPSNLSTESLARVRPTLSVMIITYNHAQYISQAIESVLSQQTDYSYEIHVVDDCSTDGTGEIIKNYETKHPGKVFCHINESNLGVPNSSYYGALHQNGEYIAVLEGDDYWIDPNRIQKHIEFLDANRNFVGCANNTIKSFEDGSGKPPELFFNVNPKEAHTIKDLIAISSFFHTSSVTLRNIFGGKLPKYFNSPFMCDIFSMIIYAQYGDIRFFPDVAAVYRIHPGGNYSTMNKTKGWMWNIDGYCACNKWLKFRYFRSFSARIWSYCDMLLRDGREDDGLTPAKRNHYQKIRTRYKRFDELIHIVDVGLSRLCPSRPVRSVPTKLNLGCGRGRRLRAINVDVRRSVEPDLVVDLERFPWPFPDNFCDEVFFDRSLEHMGESADVFQSIMRELYRVCRPGARISILAKHPFNALYFSDPTCVRPVSPITMSLFDRSTDPRAAIEPLAVINGVDFEVTGRSVVLADYLKDQFETGTISEQQAHHLVETTVNAATDYQISLSVHKPPRQLFG